MHRRPTRIRIASAALALGAVVVLAGCDKGGGGKAAGFTQSVRNGEISGRVDMDHPKIPAKFPAADVPLPKEGALQAVVSGGRHFYTFTYALGGKNGRTVGTEYRLSLEKANFKIKKFSSSGGTDGGFTTFDATSPKWDVTVVAGKGSLREASVMSVQVTTHGTLSDDLNELDVLDNGPPDTTPDVDNPDLDTSTTAPTG